MNTLLDGAVRSHSSRSLMASRRREKKLSCQGMGSLRIAIVNNMPDSAFLATERQFSSLVSNAASVDIEIGLYYLPSISRGEETRRTLEQRYLPVSHLYNSGTDALIVTGNEPRAARLDDELYWPELTRLVDWARSGTRTTLWSCLAAHAAVLHLDGIERRRLAAKKSGVLTCKFDGANQGALSVCHSRLNELRRIDLLDHKYSVVSENAAGDIDTFTKAFGSSFWFLQGHPEYAADSLMREYRRDVGRYINAQRDHYPEVPENYFDDATVIAMENYRTLVERTRDIRLFEDFPDVSLKADIEDRMARSAASLFSLWMTELLVATEAA
jgi:homoserine O-succinyltransferase/O-acetyltransferase